MTRECSFSPFLCSGHDAFPPKHRSRVGASRLDHFQHRAGLLLDLKATNYNPTTGVSAIRRAMATTPPLRPASSDSGCRCDAEWLVGSPIHQWRFAESCVRTVRKSGGQSFHRFRFRGIERRWQPKDDRLGGRIEQRIVSVSHRWRCSRRSSRIARAGHGQPRPKQHGIWHFVSLDRRCSE